MCRYAMTIYKPHYACFNCRKAFKRKLMKDINRDNPGHKEAVCPQCGSLTANMGLDFEAPPHKAIKKWEHMKTLYTVGITFHSCGCYGPGYIPESREALLLYFKNILNNYLRHLAFWRRRAEPLTLPEIQREHSEYWHYISEVPGYTNKRKNKTIKSTDAAAYWIERIQQVEGKLKLLEK